MPRAQIHAKERGREGERESVCMYKEERREFICVYMDELYFVCALKRAYYD
jgi:hypothetical protein